MPPLTLTFLSLLIFHLYLFIISYSLFTVICPDGSSHAPLLPVCTEKLELGNKKGSWGRCMRHVCLLAAIKLAYSRVPWYEPCLVALPCVVHTCICTSLSRKKFVALGSGNSWDEPRMHACMVSDRDRNDASSTTCMPAQVSFACMHVDLHVDLIYPIHIYAACSFSQWLQMYVFLLPTSHLTYLTSPAGRVHAVCPASMHSAWMARYS